MGSDEGRGVEGWQGAAQLADAYQREAHLVHHFLSLFMSPRWKLLQAKGRPQVGGLVFHFCLFASSKDPLRLDVLQRLNAFSRVQSSRKSEGLKANVIISAPTDFDWMKMKLPWRSPPNTSNQSKLGSVSNIHSIWHRFSIPALKLTEENTWKHLLLYQNDRVQWFGIRFTKTWQRKLLCRGVGVFKRATFPLETSQIQSVGKVQNNMKYDGLG